MRGLRARRREPLPAIALSRRHLQGAAATPRIVLVPHKRYCLPIGDMDTTVAAPHACSGLTTFSALNKIGVKTLMREPIVVIGAGGLGLMLPDAR